MRTRTARGIAVADHARGRGRIGMADRAKPSKSWLQAAGASLLIAWGTGPLFITLSLATGIDEGSRVEGMPFLLLCAGLVFLAALCWYVTHPSGLRGIERALLIGSGLFLAAAPVMITTGLLISDSDRGIALVLGGLLTTGVAVIQSIGLFIAARMMRRARQMHGG